MADNVTLNSGSGGDAVRTKDRAGVETQIVGLDLTIGGGSETLMNGSMPVAGDVAHDSPDSGNPVKVGAKANASAPTAVSENDRVNLWADLSGRLNITRTPRTATGSITSGASTVSVDCGDCGSVVFMVGSGLSGTSIKAQGSPDGGTTWVDTWYAPTTTLVLTITTGTSANSLLTFIVPNPGWTQIRIAVTTYGSGSASVTLVAAPAAVPLAVSVSGATVTQQAGASHIMKLEDNPSASADAGVGFLAIRKDTPANTSDTDGDYEFLQMAAGRLWVNPNMPAASQVHTNKNYTTQQTGTDVIDPGASKKIAITSVVIAAYGTTAGRVILWFGDNADTTFTQDTDQVLVAASFAPTATSKPGIVFCPATPVFCNTADRELHITTDAAISLDITIESYEF